MKEVSSVQCPSYCTPLRPSVCSSIYSSVCELGYRSISLTAPFTVPLSFVRPSVCFSLRPSGSPSVLLYRSFVHPRVHPSICWPSDCLSVSRSVDRSVCLLRSPVAPSTWPSACPSVIPIVCFILCLSVCLSARLLSFRPSARVSDCSSIHPSVR